MQNEKMIIDDNAPIFVVNFSFLKIVSPGAYPNISN
jgi:hypothetical protein